MKWSRGPCRRFLCALVVVTIAGCGSCDNKQTPPVENPVEVPGLIVPVERPDAEQAIVDALADDDVTVTDVVGSDGTTIETSVHAGKPARPGDILALIAKLNGIKTVNEVYIGGEKLSDDDLSALAELTHLTSLQFPACPNVSDEGLSHLDGLINLVHLRLYGGDITDEGLAQLAGLVNLQFLNLGRTKITGSGLTHLADLHRLRELTLSETDIDDKGVGYLPALPSLEILDLSKTLLTDDGMDQIRQFPKLDAINVEGTGVTKRGADRFRSRMPNARVLYDGAHLEPQRR